MIGLIQRRADQVVHRRIDDHEGLFAAILHIDDFGDEDTGIADDQPAGLGDQFAVEVAQLVLDRFRIGVRQRRRAVVVLVGNAETAADIDVIDGMAIGAQRRDQILQQAEGVVEGLQLGDLAADMHVDAGDFNARQSGGMGIDGAGALPGNAELVFLLAGRDLRMRAGIDIRVDAEGDRRAFACLDGALVQHFQFRLGFDVEAVDAGFERGVHLARRLADAGEHDAAGGNAGGQRPAQFAFGNHVDAGAEPGKRLQDRLVRIRLHRIADERIDIGEGGGEYLVMAFQRRGGIAIEGGADLPCDLGDRHAFRMENAVAIFEMIHGRNLKAFPGKV